ncbi:MAG: hypothetical protein AAF982_01835 [Pseudomonadota bacterium]
MKKIACAAAFSLAASTAFAGSYDDPIIEPEIIVEETSSSSAGILVPLALLVLLAVAVSN